MGRVRLILPLLLAVGVIAALAAALALSKTGGGAGATGRTTGLAGALRPAGVPVRDFTLRDERGRPLSLASYRGRVVALMFVYSTCRDTCPVTAQQVRGALDRIRRRDVTALAVSVDPAADTRPHVLHFLREQHLLGRIHYVTGSPEALLRVWRAYAVAPQRPDREHAVSVVLLDRRGRQRIGYNASDLSVDALTHDLRLLARARS